MLGFRACGIASYEKALAHLSPGGVPSVATLITEAIAHIIFFGLPVAWHVAHAARGTRHAARDKETTVVAGG